ncbi:Hint domain-containing protein [Bordetella muralis]|uniref:Hint domain-containing protein n=1 Tax=Bordetella muralis TaxID=1649130 RepID=UPI0039EE0A7E
MIQFVASKAYALELGEDGQLIVRNGYTPLQGNYLRSENEQFFTAGEHVQVWDVVGGGEFVTGRIVGFVNEGIIYHYQDDGDPENPDAYALVLTDSADEYVPRQVVTYNTDPFPGTPVCFLKGTLIETDSGPVAVECLAIGDKIVSSTGLRTVKWVGWRNYKAISLCTPEQRSDSLPVRILAGALSDNLPSQDLRVSPWHHLFIDGVLIRAKDLINGRSILQETNVTTFGYYHVELDRFDVILAHGVFSESWADGGNRSFFQNVDVTTLRPEDMQRRKARRPGFKALRKADDIAVIHERIAARAAALFIEPTSKAA